MRRKRLRKKEAREISREIQERAGVLVEGEMDVLDFEGVKIILVKNEPLLLEYEGKRYVSVYGAIKLKPEKYKITVDSGAVEHVINGADVMKPGIVYADPRIKEGDFVYVTAEPKDTPIAIGIALCGAENMKGKGKAVKNVHHLKDRIWRYLLESGFIL